MRTETAPKVTRLEDYVPPNFKINSVFLDFDLSETATKIRSTLTLTRVADGPLKLDGNDIELKSVTLDGKALTRSQYRLTQTHLILENLPQNCTLEIETLCNPKDNSTLMGLYVSGGRFCTQCEAEGFRRMTYYLDRPDALSLFKVRINAPRAFPYLLANGNMIESGELPNNRHYAVWEDPFPKPCYLFALVAGDFDILQDRFTTMSGRDIPLTIYVDKGAAPRAAYAMDSLKRSMKWDEDVYGREYDLDRFMIVAVRDFNFGAMENKGLNIFNSALLLADGESATDMNFERIESVVAHEYFHNWTGNRITCRDWFQLCLKEGFTVFRDQEFSADQRGAAVQRIKDVKALRGRQFPEDGGPLAHPVRPASYQKIDNFYTATIYEKGAELIRMLKIILGPEAFRKGCDHYFDTLDGTAATVEQFLSCFEESAGQDLSQFMRWYEQAGTPIVSVSKAPSKTGTGSHITLNQTTKPTPGQTRKRPQIIPLRWQIIGEDGAKTEPKLSLLKDKSLSFDIPELGEGSSLSILQDFSAPIILKQKANMADNLRLMRSDPNAFNRWEAGQSLARDLLANMAKSIENGKMPAPNKALKGYIRALKSTLSDEAFNANFKALALTIPTSTEITQVLDNSDPIAVHLSGQWLNRAICNGLSGDLLACYHKLNTPAPFDPGAKAAGRRALKNKSLGLLGAGLEAQAAPLALSQFKSAKNMTDEISALMTLTRLGGKRVDKSIDEFYEKWKSNPLVIDKWFAVQASRAHGRNISALKTLTRHPAYDPRNPNRVRALLGSFAMSNPVLFHRIDGEGYRFFTEQVLDMDSRNPQIAARLLGLYEIWRKLDKDRQALIRQELALIIAAKPSRNVLEIATKTRG